MNSPIASISNQWRYAIVLSAFCGTGCYQTVETATDASADSGACPSAHAMTPVIGGTVEAMLPLGDASNAGSCGPVAAEPTLLVTFTLPARSTVVVGTDALPSGVTDTISFAHDCRLDSEFACNQLGGASSNRTPAVLDAGTWFLRIRSASARSVHVFLLVMAN